MAEQGSHLRKAAQQGQGQGRPDRHSRLRNRAGDALLVTKALGPDAQNRKRQTWRRVPESPTH